MAGARVTDSRWIDVEGKSDEWNHAYSEEERQRHETKKPSEAVLLWQSDDHDQRPDDDDERQKTKLAQVTTLKSILYSYFIVIQLLYTVLLHNILCMLTKGGCISERR